MKTLATLSMLLFMSFATHAQKLVKTFYDWNNTRPKEVYYINSVGQKHGMYKEYNQYGVVITECNYVNGFANGVCSTYWYTGRGQRILAGKVTYKSGEMNGLYIAYDEHGKLKEQGHYVNDKKNGEWITITRLKDEYLKNLPDDCKFTKTVKNYKNDIQVNGIVKTYYYPSGKINREQLWYDGEPTAGETYYFPDGRIWADYQIKPDRKYFIKKLNNYENGRIAYYQTFYNDYNNDLFYAEDTLYQYTEEGFPTGYMEQQQINYKTWKRKALLNTASKYFSIGEDELNKGNIDSANLRIKEAIRLCEMGLNTQIPYPDEYTTQDHRFLLGIAIGWGYLKDTSKSIQYLSEAIAKGFSNKTAIKNHSAFNDIKGLPEYNEVLNTIPD